MTDFGIPRSKVVAIVTDNGSNFVKAFKEFGIDYLEDNEPNVEHDSDSEDGEEDSNVEPDSEEEDETQVNPVPISEMFDGHGEDKYDLPPHMRCVAHTLNLVVTTDVRKVCA